ncbi:MAG TPA: hypothetical protein PLT66_02065, partial [Bacillota bacterium]|nr:hypothetical protein [Bacillota bacterium]
MMLYGDGIHDDTAAIQAMLDSGTAAVMLDVPEKEYLISKTLVLRSDCELCLSRFTRIVLAPGSDCLMLRSDGTQNVSVSGGIWDMQNMKQAPNPLWTHTYGAIEHKDYDERYLGVAFRFFNVKNLIIRDLTLRDPVTFGIQMAEVYQFTVANIIFDYNDGNPVMGTMDGVHIEGGCRFGRLVNLQGRCYDDLVAINADDFWRGPISDITVDGIYAEGSHSAVRLLSTGSRVDNITVSGIYGTFYQYCVGIT